MATLSLATIARSMRELDICMMVTETARGTLNSRPMSNNKDVTYKGDSYYFTYDGSQKVKELEANPNVNLNYEGEKGLFISISGKAKLIRRKNAFEEHWNDSLNQWFPEGIDTPGIVLIHVKGTRLRYWQREKEGEISLKKK